VAPAPIPKEQAVAEGRPEAGRGLRILFAEDDEVSALSGRRMLELFGHAVTTARDGREALALLAQQEFDLVFMDVQMPIMDGVEVTRRVRNGEAGPDKTDIAVIALTAYAMAGDRQKLLDAGMTDYVAKPVSMASLDEAVRRVRARQRTAAA
jgi:CheY-like chemotaxis protein